MINNMPFFRLPFRPYLHRYSPSFYKKDDLDMGNISNLNGKISLNPTESKEKSEFEDKNLKETQNIYASSNYHIGPFYININGFSDKEKPLIEFYGQKLYLDELIVLILLFFLYKEDVKDEILFAILILLLVT